MTTAVCPNCALDLSPFEPIHQGPLSIPDRVTIIWHGHQVKLTRQQRLLFLTLVRADGEIVSRHGLMEAIDSDADDAINPSNVVEVQLSRIRAAFRAIDPMFDSIESVRSEGIRWRA